jgi:hypothetical protein
LQQSFFAAFQSTQKKIWRLGRLAKIRSMLFPETLGSPEESDNFKSATNPKKRLAFGLPPPPLADSYRTDSHPEDNREFIPLASRLEEYNPSIYPFLWIPNVTPSTKTIGDSFLSPPVSEDTIPPFTMQIAKQSGRTGSFRLVQYTV